MKYKVIFESKDAHKFEFSCDAESEEQATELGMAAISRNFWDQYEYEVISVIRL